MSFDSFSVYMKLQLFLMFLLLIILIVVTCLSSNLEGMFSPEVQHLFQNGFALFSNIKK